MPEKKHRTCGCCGTAFHVELPDKSREKPGFFYDLDNRPPEPARSELYRQIFRCPECGFCMGPKDRRAEREFVDSDEYRSCEGRELPESVGASYYRVAMSAERDKDIQTALAAMIRAAWYFDDEGDSVSADKCRGKYIELFPKLRGNDSGALVVLADVYRRCGRYGEVREDLKNRWFPDRLTRQIIEYEAQLADKDDRAAHSLKDCFDVIDGDK
ncbi:MAG: hypothetical protein IJ723_08205 [Ruminococcus sp.]|nr:hypothetical protein [Ruminococcus sp.]